MTPCHLSGSFLFASNKRARKNGGLSQPYSPREDDNGLFFMAKRRLINTKFWSDNFVVQLKPLERYLFLYILTNEHTEICGIYELPLEVMSRETGLDTKELLEILIRLEGRIEFIKGWVYIKNFAKNQCANESMLKGSERSLLEVPNDILTLLTEKQARCDTLSDAVGRCQIPKPKPKPKPYIEDSAKASSLSLKKTTDPRIKNLIDFFFEQTNNILGFKPTISGGKDGKAIQRSLNELSEEQIKEFFLWFLQGKDVDFYSASIASCLTPNLLNKWKQWYGNKQ